jgi:hypothetical protein
MPTVRVVSREEAQQTRASKAPGVRRARMDQFDTYAQPLVENPDEAVVYEGIDEDPQKFVLSLRGAFKRAGVSVIVRKMRGRDEVRAWTGETVKRSTRPSTAPAAAAAEPTLPPTRGRGRPKATARS